MTTDEFQAEQARKYAQQRKQDWQHKQHLDSLSSFTQRFEYWKNEVCKHDLRGTIHYDNFVLSIEPNTKEERSLLHQFHFEWYRALFIRERRPVKKSNEELAPHKRANESDTAFEVQSLDELKSDLAARVSAKSDLLEHKILLQTELNLVTNAIDSTCTPFKIHAHQRHEPNKHIPSIAGEVEHLRDAIRRSRYCYVAADELYQDQKTIQLAQVWDIVHYEAFLKDQMRVVDQNERGQPTLPTQPLPTSIPASKESSGSANNEGSALHTLLYIPSTATKALYQDLCEYIHPSDHESLRLLLYDNVAPTEKLVLTCSVADLVATFKESGAVIKGAGAVLSEQLPNYFMRNDGRQIVSLSAVYLAKVLPRKK